MAKAKCPAKKTMDPLKWVSECGKPEGHKGPHERWSETKKWKFEWTDDE